MEWIISGTDVLPLTEGIYTEAITDVLVVDSCRQGVGLDGLWVHLLLSLPCYIILQRPCCFLVSCCSVFTGYVILRMTYNQVVNILINIRNK